MYLVYTSCVFNTSYACICDVIHYVCMVTQWIMYHMLLCMYCMLQVRTAVGVAAIGGFLYAVGGECEGSRSYEPTQYLETVECYDPKTNTWNEQAKMSQPRSFAAVAVLSGELPGLSPCVYVCAGNMYINKAGIVCLCVRDMRARYLLLWHRCVYVRTLIHAYCVRSFWTTVIHRVIIYLHSHCM